jgi:hypothetical protein
MPNLSQTKLIHSLKRALGYNDDAYRAVLSGYGVESSKDLSPEACHQLIEWMQTEAVKAGKWKKPSRGERFTPLVRDREMPSRAQLRKIDAMWKSVSRSPDPESALNEFLARRFRVARIEWITRRMVPGIIKTLQAMQMQKAEGEDEKE